MLRARERRELPLERFTLRAKDVAARREHATDGRVDLRLEQLVFRGRIGHRHLTRGHWVTSPRLVATRRRAPPPRRRGRAPWDGPAALMTSRDRNVPAARAPGGQRRARPRAPGGRPRR